MVIYPFIYERFFIHVWIFILIFNANFNSKCPSSIVRTFLWNRLIYSSSLDLFLEFWLAIFLFIHSWDCPVDWTHCPYKMYYMHAFLCPLFLDECIGRCLFIPFVLNVICLRFNSDLPFPHLRIAYDDTSPCLEILNVFNFIWTLIS